MALNYSIKLKVIDENNNIIENAKVHLYFKKNNINSVDSKWDSIKYTGKTGKVDLNLGNNDFLGSESDIYNNDEVLICVWYSNNKIGDDKQSKTENTILRCVNFIHKIDLSSKSWTYNVVLLKVKSPILDINISNQTKTNQDINIINNSYLLNYKINLNNIDLYQSINFFNQDLFIGLNIKNSIYDFKSIIIKTNQENYNYKFKKSGVYNSEFKVINYLGFSSETFSKQFIITYNKPIINFNYNKTNINKIIIKNLSETRFNDNWIDLDVSFKFEISDKNQDNSNNNKEIITKDINYIIENYFKSSGNKKIKLILVWNDGFNIKSEILEKNIIIDSYKIIQKMDLITQKGYKENNIFIPVGDNDNIIINNNIITSIPYKIKWEVSNLKNNNIETFYNKDKISFYIKYNHKTVEIKQIIDFWNGFKNITQIKILNTITKKYILNQDFYWKTKFNGLNKIVISNDDNITLFNNSDIKPFNNINNSVIEYKLNNKKINNIFNIYSVEDNIIEQKITYYNGYEFITESQKRNIYSRENKIFPDFNWSSRNGENKNIVGRDDIVSFSDLSYYKDFYNKIKYDRKISIDWKIDNKILKGNFNNNNEISDKDENNIITILNKDITFKPKINFYSEGKQEIYFRIKYNNGFIIKYSNWIKKEINIISYNKPILDAIYNNNINDRNIDLIIKDNSVLNNRIIYIDWNLENQNKYKISNNNEIRFKLNKYKDYILKQKVYWDNGFKEVILNKEYIINTKTKDIFPDFKYKQIFNTGPEIRFTNITDKSLYFDLFIFDKDNFENNKDISFKNQTKSIDYKYKSCSNSPFENNKFNKKVELKVYYDNGWEILSKSIIKYICVKPNRINQDFIINPIRDINDKEIKTNIITGNNPFEFSDNSKSERLNDISFIKKVKYIIKDII